MTPAGALAVTALILAATAALVAVAAEGHPYNRGRLLAIAATACLTIAVMCGIGAAWVAVIWS